MMYETSYYKYFFCITNRIFHHKKFQLYASISDALPCVKIACEVVYLHQVKGVDSNYLHCSCMVCVL